LQRVLDQAARLNAAEAVATAEPPPAEPPPAEPYTADPEAVHDFRVALRRLRSWIRAFHPFLDDTVKASTEKKLRRLARIAGRARDLEVQSHWLHALPPKTAPLALEAARRLVLQNATAYVTARRKLAKEIADGLPQLASKLNDQLRHYLLDVDVDAPASECALAAVMAPLLREHRARVTESLATVKTREQLAAVHAARIEVKRLRYLLETLDDVSRAARAHGRRLALLQTVFGELHDAQVLQERVAEEVAASSRRVVVRKRGAAEPQAGVPPTRRAWLALQHRLDRRIKRDAGRALRAAHSHTTQRSLAAIDVVAQRLERAR
jgi:CHAD domain-containing protein